MKVVVQRVKSSSVQIDQKIKSEIEMGLLVFIGVCDDDTKSDVEWLVNKILNLRIFNDKPVSYTHLTLPTILLV